MTAQGGVPASSELRPLLAAGHGSVQVTAPHSSVPVKSTIIIVCAAVAGVLLITAVAAGIAVVWRRRKDAEVFSVCLMQTILLCSIISCVLAEMEDAAHTAKAWVCQWRDGAAG